jgi:hypothetical protein
MTGSLCGDFAVWRPSRWRQARIFREVLLEAVCEPSAAWKMSWISWNCAAALPVGSEVEPGVVPGGGKGWPVFGCKAVSDPDPAGGLEPEGEAVGCAGSWIWGSA